MLTENTGIHMCDSGGENGRHWQRNQKKKLKDFINEPDIKKDDGLIIKSIFHHLLESCEYLPEETKLFETWLKQDKTRYNSLSEIEEFMSKYTHQNKKINIIYTYNEENVLSQDIQFLYGGDIYESDSEDFRNIKEPTTDARGYDGAVTKKGQSLIDKRAGKQKERVLKSDN